MEILFIQLNLNKSQIKTIYTGNGWFCVPGSHLWFNAIKKEQMQVAKRANNTVYLDPLSIEGEKKLKDKNPGLK